MVRARSHRALSSALVAAAGFFGQAGCGSKLPPSLPSTDAHLRNASRIELVDLVISDRARAATVQRLYAEIETMMVNVKRTTAVELVKLSVDNPTRSDAETRAVVAKVRDADKAAFKRYVGLQLELRRSMTADEFAKLDAIK